MFYGIFLPYSDSKAREAIPSTAPTTTTSTTLAPPPPPPPPPTTPTTTRPAPQPPRAKTPQATAAPRPVVVTVPPAQQRGEAALAKIDFPWQRLGYTISFEPGRQGYLGLTDSANRSIRIFVRANESMDTLARTIAHEIGHAVDFETITNDEAANYIAIRGINATPQTWFGCNGCTDYQTAAGDFAETFQYWLLGDGQYFSQMGPKPTSEQLAQLAPIFTGDTPADSGA
ncbi:MAG TPA: hypothetical protein VMZ22_14000 [Acidimicrobiales bacterium]|nr:hypothetical protein [Acidimicrobiales bacterium]